MDIYHTVNGQTVENQHQKTLHLLWDAEGEAGGVRMDALVVAGVGDGGGGVGRGLLFYCRACLLPDREHASPINFLYPSVNFYLAWN